jgi:TonB family protein
MQEHQMAEAAKQWVGQIVDGKFRLGDFVGANERSAVFLTDYDAPGVRKAAIKLVAADSPDAAGLLARWRHAAELSHPHLIRLLQMGRCEFNESPILYVVMEYADENLSVVLARRPLGPAEARAILGPVVNALAYIHSKGFVHTRIKPANIMAEEDLLKISSDGLCRIGESSGALGKPGAYDPPEAAGGRISPAGDVWSLGMTLAEALTQRLPSWERINQAEPALPSTLPPEFLDLARHCLRRDPQLRWSVADIAARLNPNSTAPPKQILPNPPVSFTGQRYLGPAIVAVLVLGAIFAGARFFKHHSSAQSRDSAAILQPTVQPGTKPAVPPAKVEPKPAKKPAAPPPTAKPIDKSIDKSIAKPIEKPIVKPVQPPPSQIVAKPVPQPQPSQSVKNSGAEKPPPTNPASSRAPVPSNLAPPTSSSSGVVRGKVVQRVLPNASQAARNTIRGTVRVSVKVQVDESGAVTGASFDSRGPSQYFADRALQASQLWKFAPAKLNGRNAPSEWLLRFEIDAAIINVYPTETAP